MKTVLWSMVLIPFIFGCANSTPKTETVQTTSVTAMEKAAPTSAVEPVASTIKEWKGNCRKVVNEAGEQIQRGSHKRMQSSYVFSGKKATWFVKTYQDVKCQSLTQGYKYVFNCDADPTVKAAQCTQDALESWDGQTWKSEKMVDPAGIKDVLVIQYFLKLKTDHQAFLNSKSISDGGELTTEKLSL